MPRQDEIDYDILRKAVASYVGALIGVGIAAQAVSSGGRRSTVLRRLISTGVALASQLQREVIVRVVGAPLVRKRPGRRVRSRGGAPNHLDAPVTTPGQTVEPEEAETGWQAVAPLSLAVAQMDSQPFSIARTMYSMVAAQRSTFESLASLNSAVARVVTGTTFSPAAPRTSPSATSLEAVKGPRPEFFPADQGTSFAGATELGLAASFTRAASSLLFVLASTVRSATDSTLGSQAVGTAFAPLPPRVTNERTGFALEVRGPTSPSLAHPSISGVADTTMTVQPPGASPPALPRRTYSPPGTAYPSTPNLPPTMETSGPLRYGLSSSDDRGSSTSTGVPLTGEDAGPADLPALVGGPSSGRPSRQSGASPVESRAEPSAGTYAVPNGFNSVFFSPAFASATKLSIQVRSLASPPGSAQLPLRAEQATLPADAPTSGEAVQTATQPSSYPDGTAFSLSSVVARLGIAVSAPTSFAPLPGKEPNGSSLVGEPKADGSPVPALGTTGSALADEEREFSGGPLGASMPFAAGEVAPGGAPPAGDSHELEPAASSPDGPPLVAELRSESREGSLPGGGQVFGERWLAAVAMAAGLGGTMIAAISHSGSSAPATLAVRGLVPSPGASFRPPSPDGVASRPPRAEPSVEVAVPRAGGARGPGSPPEAEALPPAEFGALSLASSVRSLLLSTAASLVGARVATYPVGRRVAALRPVPVASSGETDPQTFARTEVPSLARTVDQLSISREPGGWEPGPQPVALESAYLPALQAVVASRFRLAARLAGSAASASSLAAEAAEIGRGRSPPTPEIAPSGQEGLAAPVGPSGRAYQGKPSLPTVQAQGRVGPPLGAASPEAKVEDAVLSLHVEGRRGAGSAFFGMEAVAKALSLAARVPRRAELDAAVTPAPSTAARAKTSPAPRAETRSTGSKAEFAVEPSPGLTEAWRSAPEEAIEAILKEPSSGLSDLPRDSTEEVDDRDLRRRIERILDEELRRHGYET